MQIDTLDFVKGARGAHGVAVIIDVFRAFSVACYAFASGARRIIPVASIGEAWALKHANPDFQLIGERHARKLDGFDYGNSPAEIEQVNLAGRTLVHTTHAGTQGLVNAIHADVVLTGSLVNAAAICRYIQRLAPARVSLVRMGQEARERTKEDDICAELLEARLLGRSYDTRAIADELRSAPSAQKFFDPGATWAPERDFDLCTEVDRFDFVLRLELSGSYGAELRRIVV